MVVSTKGICGGEPRLDCHRITVENIINTLFEDVESLDTLLVAFPKLEESDIEDVKDYLLKLLEKEVDK